MYKVLVDFVISLGNYVNVVRHNTLSNDVVVITGMCEDGRVDIYGLKLEGKKPVIVRQSTMYPVQHGFDIEDAKMFSLDRNGVLDEWYNVGSPELCLRCEKYLRDNYKCMERGFNVIQEIEKPNKEIFKGYTFVHGFSGYIEYYIVINGEDEIIDVGIKGGW